MRSRFYAHGDPVQLDGLMRFLAQLEFPPTLTRILRMEAFSGKLVPVLSVESQPRDIEGLFRLSSHRFPHLEYADSDLPFSLRYAAETGVGVLSACRLILQDGCVQFIEPLETSPPLPPLRVLELAPDCDPALGEPKAICCRGLQPPEECHLRLFPPRALLSNLNALLRSHDPDLILTDWGDTWLLPRLLDLGLNLNRFGLTRVRRIDERSYFSYGQIVYRGAQVHLAGRWHIDRQNAMLWKDYGLEGVLESARATCLPVQTAARASPGTGISAVQMLTALRQGVLIPWQKQQPEALKPASAQFAADQGGLVYQPLVGLHRDVAEIDFISMYPAIMVYYNLSPETVGPSGQYDQPIPGVDLSVNNARRGIVPLALEPILTRRIALKRQILSLPAWDPRLGELKARASALKWLLVTCFGYLGYKNARFGRIEAHQAVTACSRELLLRAKEAAEDMDGEVLHMYVDGLWIHRPGWDQPKDYDALLEEVELRCGLPIALDGIYRWVVFLASRQSANRSVANRYFGVFQDGTLKVRGLAARRHDTPAWVANVQMELLQILARYEHPSQGYKEARQVLAERLFDLRAGRVPLEGLVLSQRLSRKLEDYRSPSPAARAALQLAAMGRNLRPGQRVRFLCTLGEPGVHAWGQPIPPDPRQVDWGRYRELTLRAAAEVLGEEKGEGLFPNLLARGR